MPGTDLYFKAPQHLTARKWMQSAREVYLICPSSLYPIRRPHVSSLIYRCRSSEGKSAQVVFPAASQYSATSTAATTFAQQLTSSSSTVLAAASSVATLSLASPPTVTQKQTQSTASPSPHPPATAAVSLPSHGLGCGH